MEILQQTFPQQYENIKCGSWNHFENEFEVSERPQPCQQQPTRPKHRRAQQTGAKVAGDSQDQPQRYWESRSQVYLQGRLAQIGILIDAAYKRIFSLF